MTDLPRFLEDLRTGLGPDHELVYGFVLAFSRWEYALKIAHGGKYVGHSGEADDPFVRIRWTSWADEHANRWNTHRPDALQEWAIIKRPPQFQTKTATGELVARERPGPAKLDLKAVVELVYAVRNNLFHGGKWALRDPGTTRDEELLRECVSLIGKFVELDPELAQHFYDLSPR